MAQITHLEVAQQFNGRGRLVYKTACGEILLGHAGVRKNMDKVSCGRCRQNLGAAAKVELRVEAKVEKHWHDFNATEMHAYAHKMGWKKLGQGASRKVYDMGNNKVIKINYNVVQHGDQCKSEVKVWETASDKVKPYLAAIVDFGDGWTIMEKAESVAADMFDYELGYKIGRDLRKVTNIGDLHPHNIGYFGAGQFKIIDYAL